MPPLTPRQRHGRAKAKAERAFGIAPASPERATRDAERARASFPDLARVALEQVEHVLETVLWQCPRLTIAVEGSPQPKGRARTYVDFAGRTHTKTPDSTKHYEKLLREVAEWRVRAHGSWPLGGYDGARYVVLARYVLAHDAPDADNLAKALDALNGLAWRDDRDVVLPVPSKRFAEPGERPSATLTIWALRPPKETGP